jgi:hypothetical protein
MEAACLHGEHEDMGLVVLEVGRQMVASGGWIGLWCGLWVEALVDNKGFLTMSKLYNELPILMILYIL